MYFGRYIIALVALCLAFAPSAFSQDAMIVLDHKELGAHQRPLVRFDHDKHSSSMKCSRCHHDYDKYGNNKVEEDGQACTACHEKKNGKTRIPLEQALHTQCKNCHEDLRAQGAGNAPVMCGECHVRN